MRNKFDVELEALNTDLIEMGSMIETAIASSITALIQRDLHSAERAIEYDNEIDEMERRIERRCLKLLLQQQPVATDLRTISTALKIITDMERIGDQAADISEIVTRLAGEKDLLEIKNLKKMAEATIKMVNQSIDAFVAKDPVLSNEVIAYDDVVDDLFNQSKTELIHAIQTDSRYGEQFVDLLMIAKYFERIGDHAVNIAEWVVFSITGQHKNQKIL
ncbi:phosphate signaling complex protein PhoU [Papillibacter cinnamivorans]|uniref:Phosphate-specific transport system accessory protein PhoU n=1 Tax=Papillibacter cinnamivorans DSM 12816 TaxID=1122930 RepID=A0A1W2A905_9FIRM|nr:phosphate signaling complex protein PhoU [Papillibacter cinnamivorans]SMC57229.1 phosphate transport system protein [Papillibacter cinnamivorans DSM 12816]